MQDERDIKKYKILNILFILVILLFIVDLWGMN